MKKLIIILLVLSSCSAKKVIKEIENTREDTNIKITESIIKDDKTKTITVTEIIEPINPAIESTHNGKRFKNSKQTKVTAEKSNDVKTTENAIKEIEVKKAVEIVNTEKQKIRFDWWWLLLLLIPIGYYGYRKMTR